jgi:hypothetical protein
MKYCNSDGQQLFTTKRRTTSDSKPLIYGPIFEQGPKCGSGLIIKGEGWGPINRFNY